jgi:hypothetical protein
VQAAEGSRGAVDRIRRLRGVSWEWREEAPYDSREREAGVIAQDVQEVFPELVTRGADGYLRVNYTGLAGKLGEAVGELAGRVELLGAGSAATKLSDAEAKEEIDPVEQALAKLRSQGKLDRAETTALVGALVEAVKELDARVTSLEKGDSGVSG